MQYGDLVRKFEVIPDPVKPVLSPPEMTTFSAKYREQSKDVLKRVVRLQSIARTQKDVIKLLASLGIDMNAVDQDGLTALDYTQSRGFMPFMALQTPLFKEEAQLLRELGATKLMAASPVWPVLGPPQGVWDDIWPLGESAVHEPVYKPTITSGP